MLSTLSAFEDDVRDRVQHLGSHFSILIKFTDGMKDWITLGVDGSSSSATTPPLSQPQPSPLTTPRAVPCDCLVLSLITGVQLAAERNEEIKQIADGPYRYIIAFHSGDLSLPVPSTAAHNAHPHSPVPVPPSAASLFVNGDCRAAGHAVAPEGGGGHHE